ncbi:MAG: dTDP-glucose 4,6-dehydratase [Bradymonadales bacterium]|nr:dTDP-glucose 4,6-dehydratase [Bradymonadales bacterium]
MIHAGRRPILVTGGAGFIGTNLVHMLVLEKGVPVVNLDRLTYAGCHQSICDLEGHPDHTFVKGDICDGRTVRELLFDTRPGAVIHLAAETHVDRSIADPEGFVRTNVTGTWRLLEETRRYLATLEGSEQGAFRLLVVSTDEVFGELGEEGFFSESSPYRPSSPYSASKAAADHFARAYQRTFGLPVLVSHSSNNYGPYQHPEKLIPRSVLRARNRLPIEVYGTGHNVRDWLHVRDHCEALWLILQRGRPGVSFNVGGGEERRNLEVVGAICDYLDRFLPPDRKMDPPIERYRELIRLVSDRPGHDHRYALDTTRIRQELGWLPQIRFEQGLADTVRWYVDHPDWVAAILSSKAAEPR